MANPDILPHEIVVDPPAIPLLVDGERLTRAEFERRYDAMPDLKKAELIDGVVYMPSPVRVMKHGSPHAKMIGWLVLYEANTPGVHAADNSSVRLGSDSEPQPDATLFVEPSHGGRVQISADDYIEDGPELLGEVSASSTDIDLTKKFRLYRRNNVFEYIVWRVEEKAIDWFKLHQGQYERLPLSADGIYRSEVFPGLWLDVARMIAFDLAGVLQVLQQGIASPEHADFVKKLRQHAQNRTV